jgi:hypothetical protein
VVRFSHLGLDWNGLLSFNHLLKANHHHLNLGAYTDRTKTSFRLERLAIQERNGHFTPATACTSFLWSLLGPSAWKEIS